MQKLSLMLIALFASAGLTACGGGGNDNAGTASTAAPATTTATATPVNADCPTGYKSISMSKSSIQNATMSITAENATFTFKTPATATPSIKLCLGVATTAFAPAGGLQVLGKTYDLKVIALDSSNATLATLLNPTIQIFVDKAQLLANTSLQDISGKARIYTDSDGGLAPLPAADIALIDANGAGVTLTAGVAKPGRFVVAYKL